MPALHKGPASTALSPLHAAALALCLVAGPAVGQQVYKCGAVYSDKPCGQAPAVVDLKTYQPSAREQALARHRAQVDQRDAAVLERQQAYERQRQAAERRIAAQQQASEEAAFKARCSGYERTAKAAGHEKDLYLTQRFRDDAERRKREAEAQHFSECYGAR